MKLAIELRSLVHESVAILGQVIKRRLGRKAFQRIEIIRQEMTELRDSSDEKSFQILQLLTAKLEKVSADERYEVAQAFTLMLELMNASENAYRSFRLTKHNKNGIVSEDLESITYVLTAHPTEARSPQNVAVFHEIQNLLLEVLESSEPGKKVVLSKNHQDDLLHLLEIAWLTPIVRQRKPKVKDEAEYIYSQVFRDEIIFSLLEANEHKIPFSLHSWVGGDKDGHPGVDEKVMLQSLNISRKQILNLIIKQLLQIKTTFELVSVQSLHRQISKLQKILHVCRVLKAGDAKRIEQCKNLILKLRQDYLKTFGSEHPGFRKLDQMLKLFPGMVIPLELRESSDVLMAPKVKGRSLAIERMLEKIYMLSGNTDPSFYARSFIISMTESAEHLRTAALIQKRIFGQVKIPVVPLFEEASSLAKADKIMQEALKDPMLKTAIQKNWNKKVEMMVGYSDSSKEAGVLPSRLAIAEALPKLERICLKRGLKPVFFHGSGGSVDRGGGSIEDQTAWWPRSAVARYKVTVQGEMVERSLASPIIAKRQVEKISQSASAVLKKPFRAAHDKSLDQFAGRITKIYGAKITDPDFLQVVTAATPYSYINILKIGSRPAKRTTELTVKGLRAIPWILCWTQTRLLFPIWWGVGSAWLATSPQEKKNLKKAFHSVPVFTSYVKALDFTLAKVEISVFKLYLSRSGLPTEQVEKFSREIERELRSTLQFCKAMTGQNLLSWKLWLKESVELRSPMIHPLNLLQSIAQKNRELALLRLTVTGISSGMMSTG